MYTIIGGDGREYGPVTAEQVRQWIAAGRANLDTRTKAVGSDEWKTVAEYAEIVQPVGVEPPTLSPYAGAASGKHGSRWFRFFAFILDSLISAACWIPFFMNVDVNAALAAIQNSDVDALIGVNGFTRGVTYMAMTGLGVELIQILLLSLRGQTIAKFIFRIRIVRFPDAAPAGFVRAWLIRRFVWGIFYLIPYLNVLLFLVDSCFIFGENRRTLHDRMAGTKVIPTS